MARAADSRGYLTIPVSAWRVVLATLSDSLSLSLALLPLPLLCLSLLALLNPPACLSAAAPPTFFHSLFIASFTFIIHSSVAPLAPPPDPALPCPLIVLDLSALSLDGFPPWTVHPTLVSSAKLIISFPIVALSARLCLLDLLPFGSLYSCVERYPG